MRRFGGVLVCMSFFFFVGGGRGGPSSEGLLGNRISERPEHLGPLLPESPG